uniref:Protein farnesyltransferase/geranylgeranyltransferase type-1 subunit alpha n=1 Tax=Parastrongyloides trichosuri TaxID=131310 RepID=A0A0N4ZX61_PARTI
MVYFAKDDPIFDDVKPIYPSKEEVACVKILFTDEFIDNFAYIRALIHSGEYSERAFDLSTKCLLLNPGNYSVWKYRRDCLLKLNKDFKEELNAISSTILKNPKNYQVWRHRQEIVNHLDDYSEESSFIQEILNEDSKNYHAWQYRVWLLKQGKLLFVEELEFINLMLADDIRNNSAWHYRQVVFGEFGNLENNKEAREKEMQFVMDAIQAIDNNESSWNYFFWICNITKENLEKGIQFAKKLEKESESSRIHANVFLMKGYVKLLNENNCEDLKNDVRLSCNRLKEVDNNHSRYWEKIIEKLENNS